MQTPTASPPSSAFSAEQVRSLPAAQLRELERLLTPRLTKYIPHQPTPTQTAFLLVDCFEALFGGAAGGGKSDALLMAALQYADVPGYSAILFRETFAELAMAGGLMERAASWLRPTDAHWDGLNHRWIFPSGALLSFGYMANDNDRLRYKSAEFQLAGFDELTAFSEVRYRYIASRMRRRTGINVPLRMRGATNPDGPGASWVQRRFLLEGEKHGRVFIPSLLKDNPHVDEVSYRHALAQLDPATRAALEDGLWGFTEKGPMFDRLSFKPVAREPNDLRLVRYWDLAATKQPAGQQAKPWTAGVRMGLSQYGDLYVCHVRRAQEKPGVIEEIITETAASDGVVVPVRMEQEPGSGGVNTVERYRTLLLGYDFDGKPASGDKIARARPFSGAAGRGRVYIVEGDWNTDFLDELEAFGKPRSGFAKDQVDACSGAMAFLTGTDEEAEHVRDLVKAYGAR